MDFSSLSHYLNSLGIRYTCHWHEAVFTSAQARRLIPALPGVSAKNLFLRDRKGKRFFLLVIPDTKKLDLKSLAARLGLAGLSLASLQRLQSALGVESGAVSLLALVNDKDCRVEVLIDQELMGAEQFQCHPLINSATLVLSRQDLEKFLSVTGHRIQWMEI